MSRLQQYWSLNLCRMWQSYVDETMSRHWTEYRMEQIQQTDVCVFHDPHWKGCLPNHIMWQLLYCSFNCNFEHWTFPNIITRPKIGARVMKTPIEKFNVITFNHDRTGFYLTDISILRFFIPQCREGRICNFLDPNIIQCTDQLGVDLFESIHP